MPIASKRPETRLQFRPVTPERLADLERFSEEHGKFGYCSCMRWRMTSSEYRKSSKVERADNLYARVIKDEVTGILAYDDSQPIGWCSVGPRESYAALERYSALPRFDHESVWSVVCFFVDRGYRRQGMTIGLLNAAVDYAAAEGARVVEGYPVEPTASSYTYMGSPNTFLQAGFKDVTPSGQKRTVMRRHISASERTE